MKKIYLSLILLTFGTQTLSAQNKTTETLLETCGVLSTQGVYITYSGIGILADAYVSGVYDDATATEVLTEYIMLSEAVNEQLNTVLKTGILVNEDIDFIIDLNNIYELLISEADAFSKYITTKDESYAHVYDNSRIKAWNEIAKLLGLE